MACDPCICNKTTNEKLWSYDEYYIGAKDSEQRRNGKGENHWTGAESIEWYTGHFIRDTMNGYGDYRWRYRGSEHAFVTYEGNLLANRLHGYGVMSYPNGKIFSGLYYNNVRWGPGIESHINLLANVGFWRGTQLVRLAWQPATASVVINLVAGNNGQAYVENYRIKLARSTKIIGESNRALELLKQCGAEAVMATEKWAKLYPKYCTDLDSQACYVEAFEKDFYKGKIISLEEVRGVYNPEYNENDSQDSRDNEDKKQCLYFAWNNTQTTINMMKHCYKHDKQRAKVNVNLPKILNGLRRQFRPAAKHERDCRTLFMASYLGHITNVAQLINEYDVYPDVADMKGNTPLMYAACGDQPEIINFLVQAGANINCYNDSCCTPLAMALVRFACIKNDIAPKGMLDALLPPRGAPAPAAPAQPEIKVSDWLISRDASTSKQPNEPTADFPKMVSRASKVPSIKKLKSTMVGLEASSATSKRKIDTTKSTTEKEYDSDDSFSEEKRLYSTINTEYRIKVNNIFAGPNVTIPYMFTIRDMMQDLDMAELSKDKKIGKQTSKLIRSAAKSAKSLILWQTNDMDEFSSLNSCAKVKIETLAKIMLTILDLLRNGADPTLVQCPQPALLIAMASGTPDLVRHLINYGSDVNAKYPGALGYSALDIAVSRPLVIENLEMIRVLLANGADTNHRLPYHNPEIPGPTLLHLLFARQPEYEFSNDILHQIIELFLKFHYNPFIQFRGQSVIDIAMDDKIDLFDIFIKSPKVDLNKIINSKNQNILVKMFSLEFHRSSMDLDCAPILTNLLLYGADPLKECYDEENTYANIFAYSKIVLDKINTKPTISDAKIKESKQEMKGKAAKSTEKNKPKPDFTLDDPVTYQLSVDLVIECARLLHIRWLQAKLMKELIATVHKYEHRPWIMIIKEHKYQTGVGLWLTPQRCLEIWDILKKTKKKIYKDDRLLKYLLYIVQFYNKRSCTIPFNLTMTTSDKNVVETEVAKIIKEQKMATKLASEAEAWKGFYVKPELEVKTSHKYNICFECCLPLEGISIICETCCLIAFCCLDCIKKNIDRAFCHPCSYYMKEKYFPSPASSDIDVGLF